MKLAVFVFIIFLAGCATLTDYQASCEQRYPAFADFAACFKAEVEADRRGIPAKDPRVKLLLLKTEQIAGRVARGEITDFDAKVEFQQTFVNLRSQAMAENSAPMPVLPSAPVKTTCTTSGNYTTCRSK